MEYEEFLHQVMQRAHLPNSEDAARMARAVLETLGERLGDREQQYLQAQLPREMKGWIHQCPNGKSYPLEQFYDRVGRRAKLIYPKAFAATRIVLALLRQAISDGEMRDILETLPEDYRLAFEMKSPHVA